MPLLLAMACGLVGPARAQQLIGYVNTRDADVMGASDVLDGQAVLTGSVSVTAKDHTAPITLGRGGTVRVCQTSQLHLTEGRAAGTGAPLLFSLDRGAIEIQMNGTASDAIMTPDLRFTVRNGGALDLRMRVARNGDTCVENRGPGAPTLAVSDPFGEALYELAAGQHVLFEHGSLHEVVDHESSPCGCPDERGMSMADALLAPGGGGGAKAAGPPPASQADLQAAEQSAARAAVQAANQHPFPAAISEGLAPAPPAAQAAPGVVQAQVSDGLRYPPEGASAGSGGGSAGAPSGSQAGGGSAQAGVQGSSAPTGGPTGVPMANVAAPAPPASSKGKKTQAAKASVAPAPAGASAQVASVKPAPTATGGARRPASQPTQASPAPVPPQPKRDLAHVIGRFFKRLFGG
jgi:hypothetical protein